MIRTVIIGAGGYSGAELVGLLTTHAHVELVGLFGSLAKDKAGPRRQFSNEFPRWRGIVDMPIASGEIEDILELAPDAVFLATPPEVSHEIVPALWERGIVALDFSAAFRLADVAAYPKHYGFNHEHPELLEHAVYGLPERFRTRIRNAQIIALPGCYPTSIVLPVAALNEVGAIDAHTPVIADCTSGVSGAGRSAALKSMFCEVSFQPYAVLSHRHQPEIEQYTEAPVIFTPHLGPFDRGIVSTIHATLGSGWTESAIREALHGAYGNEPFVRLLLQGEWPSVAAVRGTNFCDIGLAVDSTRNHLIIVSALDNLLKGAAGQAVQCFNERFGFPVESGLLGGSLCLAN